MGNYNEMVHRSLEKKRNGWKFAFLSLLVLLIGAVIFIFFRISQLREVTYPEKKNITELAGSQVASVNSNKKQLNALIDFYLVDYQKDSDIKYDFYLEDDALLNGTFQLLGYPVQFSLYFDPYVMENGNIQLKAKSLSIGMLELPIRDILAFVQKEYKIPEWAEVLPDKNMIILQLDAFKINKGLFVRAEQLDLVDDAIRFGVYLPEGN